MPFLSHICPWKCLLSAILGFPRGSGDYLTGVLVAVLVAALAVTPVWGSIVRVSAVDPGANLAAGVQTVSSSAVFPPRPAGQSPESKISTPLRLAAQRVQSLAANGAFTDSVP